MCVLVVAWKQHAAAPLVVAANRDEAYARPASTPRVEVVEGTRVLLPSDHQAGGTWEGANEAGLVAVITNRPDGDFDPARRSRGLLCRMALSKRGILTLQRDLEVELSKQRYNSFNLFYADEKSAYVSSWNGDLRTQRLEPGTYVLSNEHGIGELVVSELAALPRAAPPFRRALVEILASHRPRDTDGFRICKHGERYGTVSASLIYRDGHDFVLEHAPGPPCVTRFTAHRIRALPANR
ncbi:MAG: NRDE family protein [Candidatus Latescibacterota bacterium]|nr:MAG: NRDE family protein [Candidatus Latescibacterota bacterium]